MKMRKRRVWHLLSRIIVLVLVIFLCSALVRSIIGLPYAWVTDRMMAAENVLAKNDEGYNTIFVGSSKTFRGINPMEFDDYVNQHLDEKVKSFNYGLGGATSGQIYGLARNIIKTHNKNIKYLFVELRSVETSVRRNAFVKNLHTKRATIWVKDFAALRYALRSFWGAKHFALSFGEKLRFSFYFVVKYFDNRLNIGLVEDMIERRDPDINYGLELGKDGFVGLEESSEPALMNRRKKFLKDATQTVNESRLHSLKTFGSNSMDGYVDSINRPYVDEMNKLIAYGKEHNVKVIVVALPLLKPSDYRCVYPVFSELPNDSKIDLCNSKSNTELYMVEHCWDESHRNRKGAKLMSHRAGQRFLTMMGYKKPPVPYWNERKAKKKKSSKKNAL